MSICAYSVVLWTRHDLRVAAAAEEDQVRRPADQKPTVLRKPHCVRRYRRHRRRPVAIRPI